MLTPDERASLAFAMRTLDRLGHAGDARVLLDLLRRSANPSGQRVVHLPTEAAHADLKRLAKARGETAKGMVERLIFEELDRLGKLPMPEPLSDDDTTPVMR